MRIEVHVPPMPGQRFPVYAIAHSRAYDEATAGGMPFDQATYLKVSRDYGALLLQEAITGRLRVCNQRGLPVDATQYLALCQARGSVEVIDEDTMQRNTVLTSILALFTKTKWAQEWAGRNGDEIVVVVDQEWIGRGSPTTIKRA